MQFPSLEDDILDQIESIHQQLITPLGVESVLLAISNIQKYSQKLEGIYDSCIDKLVQAFMNSEEEEYSNVLNSVTVNLKYLRVSEMNGKKPIILSSGGFQLVMPFALLEDEMEIVGSVFIYPSDGKNIYDVSFYRKPAGKLNDIRSKEQDIKLL
jgi:hypothetical protein